MRNIKLFIDGDSLYIYKFKSTGKIYVVSVEDSEDGYSIKNLTLETNLTGQELEKYIVYSFANYKPEVTATDLTKDEVYDTIKDIGAVPDTNLLNPFILPEKKQTPVESILEQILQLSYKERSDVLVALLDMM